MSFQPTSYVIQFRYRPIANEPCDCECSCGRSATIETSSDAVGYHCLCDECPEHFFN